MYYLPHLICLIGVCTSSRVNPNRAASPESRIHSASSVARWRTISRYWSEAIRAASACPPSWLTRTVRLKRFNKWITCLHSSRRSFLSSPYFWIYPTVWSVCSVCNYVFITTTYQSIKLCLKCIYCTEQYTLLYTHDKRLCKLSFKYVGTPAPIDSAWSSRNKLV